MFFQIFIWPCKTAKSAISQSIFQTRKIYRLSKILFISVLQILQVVICPVPESDCQPNKCVFKKFKLKCSDKIQWVLLLFAHLLQPKYSPMLLKNKEGIINMARVSIQDFAVFLCQTFAQNALLHAPFLNLGYDKQNRAVSAEEVAFSESLKVFLCCTMASSGGNRFPVESRNMGTRALGGSEEGWGWMGLSASVLLSPGRFGEAQCT